MLASLAPLARFAPTVLAKVADTIAPGTGEIVRKLHEWYRDERNTTEKAKILKALEITDEKLNAFDRMFIILGKECGELLDRVAELEACGQDSSEEIAREVLRHPEIQERFDSLGLLVGILEDDVRRLDDKYASLSAFANELKENQLTDTELADFRAFRQAKRFQAAGQFAESEPILLKLANTQPKSAAVAVAQAVAKHDNPTAFEAALRRAVKLKPDDDELKKLTTAATVAVTKARAPAEVPTPTSRRVPQVGDTLDGWLLEARLGGGGWGIVFRGTKKGQTKALKVMRPDLSAQDEFVEAFTDEVFKLLRLKHANIVAVERNGFCTGFMRHYFVMPLLDGLNLEQHLARHGVPSAEVAMGWLTGLLDGLDHAHTNGLIHRDVKPLNVMILPDGRAVLIDFGIAGLADVPGHTQVLGKTSFFAPPEMHGLGEADTRADFFMLAATVFYALRFASAQRDRAWNKYKPDRVPDVFRAVLSAALSADEEQRPATAGEMRNLSQTTSPAGIASNQHNRWKTTCPVCKSRLTFPPHRVGERAKCLRCSQSLLLPRRDGEFSTVPPDEPFELVLAAGVKLKFIWCLSGTFLMGSSVSEIERDSGEIQHEVNLTSGFFMSVAPVTQRQWVALMNSNPSTFQGNNHPVETVSWEDANQFCFAAAKATGKAIRLPTEAEWEYAARGGKKLAFHWGSKLNGTQANCDGRQPYGTDREGPFIQTTLPVGSYAAKYPHPWGLVDVHGNVWEWCADEYLPAYYSQSPKDDPLCCDGEFARRVLRGGSWFDEAKACRAAVRHHEANTGKNSTIGFRVALSSTSV